MSETVETMKIKPAHADQGEFVVINKADFDPAIHEEHGIEVEASKRLGIAELREALTQKGIEFPKGAKAADLQSLLDAEA